MRSREKIPLAQSDAGRRAVTTPKAKGKPNGSILSFFRKTDSPRKAASTAEEQDGLFFEDDAAAKRERGPIQVSTLPKDRAEPEPGEEGRYHELGMSVKRRKISSCILETTHGETGASRTEGSESSSKTMLRRMPLDMDDSTVQAVRDGPFVEDDPEAPESAHVRPDWTVKEEPEHDLDATERGICQDPPDHDPLNAIVPSPAGESTNIAGGDDFECFEDFIDDDEFPEDGEEYMERRWMERQGGLEVSPEDDEGPSKDMTIEAGREQCTLAKNMAGFCPVCSIELEGVTTEVSLRIQSHYPKLIAPKQASVHVNNCLDGNPTPLPERTISSVPVNVEPGTTCRRFQRAAIPRPGQENPFALGTSAGGGSAFSKLMSSHAEDSAWATAAANELAARGKRAFKRTCPFYKILPGFFICVDAFRYGAVEGCNAYFLSHFHSDHYIGLSSSWCHGPIYCSRVTANLVRQQLRVDPKWIVGLEFDQKAEVPGTQGVEVTMIPANHCPGSSLFLYEKAVGGGKNPRIQRVLHCGDFRACPAHVQHPLLRPDVIDAVSGKRTRRQKLDVCYLDTTYLTPKYSFPRQEEVIRACADMCVSLSKDRVDEADDWERAKKDRAGSGMVKFVRNDSAVKEEVNGGDGDGSTGVKANGRGRLLVILGTYSIGKEKICLGVARALDSKIYAAPGKQKICAALEDPELSARLTDDPLEAQVHMQMLTEIRAETLADYLASYRPHFSRIVGFRPSGWNYRPPNGRRVELPAVQTVLHSDGWKSRYTMAELVPQRGSTREAACFGVPYSEHSSFRELTMFCCALTIDRIVPTVNVGSARSREKMKAWIERWAADKKKNGLFRVDDGQTVW